MNTNIKQQWLAEMQDGKFERDYYGVRIHAPLTPAQYLTDLYRRRVLKKGVATRWNRTMLTNELSPGVVRWAGLRGKRAWLPISHRSVSLLGDYRYPTNYIARRIENQL